MSYLYAFLGAMSVAAFMARMGLGLTGAAFRQVMASFAVVYAVPLAFHGLWEVFS